MMDVLIQKYHERRKLYLSWDAASWHISKRLLVRIEAHNAALAMEAALWLRPLHCRQTHSSST